MFLPLSAQHRCDSSQLQFTFSDRPEHQPQEVAQENVSLQNEEVNFLQIDSIEDVISNWIAQRNNNEAGEIINLWSYLSERDESSIETPSFNKFLKLTCDILEADGMDEFQLATLSSKISEFDAIPKQLIKVLCKAIESRLTHTPCLLKNLSVFLWSFAIFKVNELSLLDILIQKIEENLNVNGNVDGEDCGYMIFALAKLGYKHESLLYRLIEHIQLNLYVNGYFSGQDIAHIVWAYAELGNSYYGFVTSIKNFVVRILKNINFFAFSDAIRIAWAFAVFKISDQECFDKLLSIIEDGLNQQNVVSEEEQQQLFELYELLLLSGIEISQYEHLSELIIQMKSVKIRKELRNEELTKCVMDVLRSLQCNQKNGISYCRVSNPTFIVGQSVLYPVVMKIAVGSKSIRSPKVQKEGLRFVIEMSHQNRFLIRQAVEYPGRRSNITLARLDRFINQPKPNTKRRLLEMAGWKYAEVPHFKWSDRNDVQRNSYIATLVSDILRKTRDEFFVRQDQDELGSDLQRLSLEQKD